MKAFPTTAIAALAAACAFALSGCAGSLIPSAANTQYKKYAPCMGGSSTHISRLPGARFPATGARSCVQSLDPFDLAAWVEAPIVSYKERGLATMALGCANLVPDGAGCEYGGLPGHSATMQMNFNMGTYPATARVQKAALAFYVESNATFFRSNAQIRARLSTGDQLQSVGDPRFGPVGEAGWIVVDITDFAARAVSEQRASVSFEISLPCGRDEKEITIVRVTKTPPVLVVEYR
ncbi:MAG: hypothetical protein LBQ12_08265 [Deltaproteobacteria bacterium]|jgi:hypothetical protein|nr:hypothetical protein [Deltaproteobacteria bacterium]